MPEIVFWGATGQSRVLHEAISGSDMRLAALVDNRKFGELRLLGVPLLHGELNLDEWLAREADAGQLYYAIAVGGAHGGDRLMLMDTLERRGLRAWTIIHRTAFVATDAIIGAGCQVLAHSSVCAVARLGRGVIVNTAASVDHDSELCDGVHVGPGARLAGETYVGERSFIGTGAIVLPRVRIGEDVVVGAGAVVLHDVPAGTTVVGNPARPLLCKERL
jgi:sugar O-acyltransferase (sialic acid O-acetyltransferase NeuD family)